MKLVLIFVGYDIDLSPFETAVHPALLPLANNCLLGHGVAEMMEPGVRDVVLVVNDATEGEALRAWLAANYEAVGCEVVVTEATDNVAALQPIANKLGSDGVFLATGHTAFDVRWASFGASEADMIVWAAANEGDSGVYWLRDGRDLAKVMANLTSLTDLPTAVSALDRTVEEQRPDFCASVSSLESWFFANARLLALGFATEDAIERGYGDEFVVLPPIFIDETAVVEQCVIGPFVTIGAHAEVIGSVVSNSIIGANAVVENTHLDKTILGQGVNIEGEKQSLIVADSKEIG
ncbi:MAG: hypothetical protein AAF614_22765 [Chloroflexota bacterium]